MWLRGRGWHGLRLPRGVARDCRPRSAKGGAIVSLFNNLPGSQAGLAFPAALAEKYRPHSFAEFVGLDKPKRILSKFADAPYPSAWLFVGSSGTGKTSRSLAFWEAILGEHH